MLWEHLLDEFHRIQVRPYKESINWILLVIPGVVMKELENAANMRREAGFSNPAAEGTRRWRRSPPSSPRKGTRASACSSSAPRIRGHCNSPRVGLPSATRN